MKGSIYKLLALLTIGILLMGCGQAGQTSGEEVKVDENTQMELVTETESVVEPVVTTVTITATGDCTLGSTQYHEYGGSFHQYYDFYGEAYFFENYREVFEEDDVTLINLECVFSNSNNRVEKTYSLKGKPEYTGILTSSSIEACSLGNNHSRDYGPESLIDTQYALEEAGVAYAYNDIVAYYTTDEGMVVAIVSASVTASTISNDVYLKEGVAEAKEQGADLVIACCHWGIEGDHYPTDYQQQLGHTLIDAGADLVIGNHPHVLQGIEEYNGKIICYSLGNFSFGANRNPEDKNTAVFQQTFTFVDGELQNDITAKIIPSRLSSHDGYNDFQPIIAEGNQAISIIEKMNQYSKSYSGVSFDEEGILILAEE